MQSCSRSDGRRHKRSLEFCSLPEPREVSLGQSAEMHLVFGRFFFLFFWLCVLIWASSLYPKQPPSDLPPNKTETQTTPVSLVISRRNKKKNVIRFHCANSLFLWNSLSEWFPTGLNPPPRLSISVGPTDGSLLSAHVCSPAATLAPACVLAQMLAVANTATALWKKKKSSSGDLMLGKTKSYARWSISNQGGGVTKVTHHNNNNNNDRQSNTSSKQRLTQAVSPLGGFVSSVRPSLLVTFNVIKENILMSPPSSDDRELFIKLASSCSRLASSMSTRTPSVFKIFF